MIILARHGQSLNNRQFKFCGKDDPPLTKKGVRQSEQLVRTYLKRYGRPPDKILSGPQQRHIETAIIAARQFEIPYCPEGDVLEQLAERSVGVLEGKRYWHALRYWRNLVWLQTRPHHWDINAPEMMTLEELHTQCSRFLPCLREMHQATPDTLLIGSEWVLRMMITVWRRQAAREFYFAPRLRNGEFLTL